MSSCKIIVTGNGRGDKQIRSTILGLSPVGRNSLLHRYLQSMLGNQEMGRHLPRLRRFCETLLSEESRWALIKSDFMKN